MGNKIKCSYHLCNKEIEEKECIEKSLHFMQGVIPTTELKKYCCEQCAVHDQMAHDL